MSTELLTAMSQQKSATHTKRPARSPSSPNSNDSEPSSQTRNWLKRWAVVEEVIDNVEAEEVENASDENGIEMVENKVEKDNGLGSDEVSNYLCSFIVKITYTNPIDSRRDASLKFQLQNPSRESCQRICFWYSQIRLRWGSRGRMAWQMWSKGTGACTWGERAVRAACTSLIRKTDEHE
jgi:hypothetical protein